MHFHIKQASICLLSQILTFQQLLCFFQGDLRRHSCQHFTDPELFHLPPLTRLHQLITNSKCVGVGECVSYWRANLHFPCLLCLTFANIDFWRRGLVEHRSTSSCPLVQIIASLTQHAQTKMYHSSFVNAPTETGQETCTSIFLISACFYWYAGSCLSCSAGHVFAALLGPRCSLSSVCRVWQIKKETNFRDPFLITSHASLAQWGLPTVSAGRSESLCRPSSASARAMSTPHPSIISCHSHRLWS